MPDVPVVENTFMRAIIMVGAALMLAAGPLYAQTGSTSLTGSDRDRAYVNLGGGVAVSPDATSGDILGEAGVRVARNLFVFGDIGQFHNLQPSLVQPAVDVTAALLSATGVSVTGIARVPAWYTLGGARYEMPTRAAVLPYILGGIGFARLTPSAQFTYGSGVIGTATPSPGDDVTSELVSLGEFTQPAASNAFMFTLGGGVEVPVAPHLSVDVGYRLSRVDADTPLTNHSVVAGVGYKF
jgi:opacity protein-like surface antigen